MVFYRSLSENKSPQILRFSQKCGLDGLDTFSAIQLSQSFPKPLETVPSAPTRIGITATDIFQNFFFVLSQNPGICRPSL